MGDTTLQTLMAAQTQTSIFNVTTVSVHLVVQSYCVHEHQVLLIQ